MPVPAGGTASYLNYLVSRKAGAAANVDVQTQAAALTNMTQTDIPIHTDPARGASAPSTPNNNGHPFFINKNK
jgi:hypothetical protein